MDLSLLTVALGAPLYMGSLFEALRTNTQEKNRIMS